jgi:hypothetical protein
MKTSELLLEGLRPENPQPDTLIKAIRREVCRELVPSLRTKTYERSNPYSQLENHIYHNNTSPMRVNKTDGTVTWSLQWSLAPLSSAGRAGWQIRGGPKNEPPINPERVKLLIPIALKKIVERARKADIGLIAVGIEEPGKRHFKKIPPSKFDPSVLSIHSGSLQFVFEKNHPKIWSFDRECQIFAGKLSRLAKSLGYAGASDTWSVGNKSFWITYGAYSSIENVEFIVYPPGFKQRVEALRNDPTKAITDLVDDSDEEFHNMMKMKRDAKLQHIYDELKNDYGRPDIEKLYKALGPLIKETQKGAPVKISVSLQKRAHASQEATTIVFKFTKEEK